MKKFLIKLAILDIMCERELQNYDMIDFLNIKRLNPYYWKLKN